MQVIRFSLNTTANLKRRHVAEATKNTWTIHESKYFTKSTNPSENPVRSHLRPQHTHIHNRPPSDTACGRLLRHQRVLFFWSDPQHDTRTHRRRRPTVTDRPRPSRSGHRLPAQVAEHLTRASCRGRTFRGGEGRSRFHDGCRRAPGEVEAPAMAATSMLARKLDLFTNATETRLHAHFFRELLDGSPSLNSRGEDVLLYGTQRHLRFQPQAPIAERVIFPLNSYSTPTHTIWLR